MWKDLIFSKKNNFTFIFPFRIEKKMLTPFIVHASSQYVKKCIIITFVDGIY